jgi:hypothetical protein
MQTWELDSAVYATLEGESAPDCTPEHSLPGARCNHTFHNSSLNSSAVNVNSKCTCNASSAHLLDPNRPCSRHNTCSSSVNRSHRTSGNDCALSSLLSQQLSELRLQSNDQSTGSSSGCHSQSTLASDETLYVNTQRYENWSAFDSNPTSGAPIVQTRSNEVERENEQFKCNDERIEESSTRRIKDKDKDKLTPSQPFDKRPSGRLLALYSYVPVDENDVLVRRGELLTALNRDDPNWLWVVKSNGQQGFVPANFVCPLELVSSESRTKATYDPSPSLSSEIRTSDVRLPIDKSSLSSSSFEMSSSSTVLSKAESTCRTSEHLYSNVPLPVSSSDKSAEFDGQLVVLFDFDAQAPDDLSVRRGEWVMTRLADQQIEGWLWVYSPRSARSGYIPKAYARPPAMTSL